MGWTAKDIEQRRNAQKKDTKKNDTAKATTGTGWTESRVAGLRRNAGAQQSRTTEAWQNRDAGTSTRGQTAKPQHLQMVPKPSAQTAQTVQAELANPMLKGSPTLRKNAGNWLGGGERVLGTVTPRTNGSTGTTGSVQKSNTGSPVSTDRQEDYEPNWNYVGGTNTPAQRAAQVQAQDAKQMHRDDFDKWNQWMDADPRHRELVNLMREKQQDYTSYAERGTSAGATTVGTGSGAYTSYAQQGKSRDAGQEADTQAKYTDADLLKMGYSQKEIHDARQYLSEYTAYNPAATFTRRTADWAKGLAGTVASALPMVGEQAAQAYLNNKATQANRAALRQEVAGDERQSELLKLMQSGKYMPEYHGVAAYTDAELREKGYTQDEIDAMRSRIAGTEVHDSVPEDISIGYKLADWGNKHTNAWLSGMSPTEKAIAGVAGSAAENLAVAGISPALVLPVLSAQGGAESMYQSMEKDEDAGTALAKGALKFGAGWAINSVGAADLARTMGSDYAKDTLAGQIADSIRKVSGNSAFAQAHPAIANAISGGIDNAMQAFVETYADTAIDAALGDDAQAEALFKPETFFTALESGLTGGASGALGGAVGTGLGAMSGTLAQYDYETQAAQVAQQWAQQQVRAEERTAEPSQLRDEPAAELGVEEAPREQEALSPAQSTAPSVEERAASAEAVSDNAAVQQFERVVQAGQLTGKTIGLFTPNTANEANRAAFAEAYGVQLPDTAAATRRALREMAAVRTETAQAGTDMALRDDVREAEQEETPSVLPSADAVRQDSSLGEGAFPEGNTAVENTGERVESETAPAQERAAPLRETIGLRQQSLTEKQRSVQRELSRWKVSEGASETISRMVPDSINDLDRYTNAANAMYRMGQMEDVTTFDKALELARGSGAMAPYTDYVLQQPGGESALRAAWTQGHGELEAGSIDRGMLGGALGEQSTSGEGVTYWKGSERAADDMATQLIRLNAQGTGTDAVLKSVLAGPDGTPSERVRGYIDTLTGRIFFSDRNLDVFSTILHEDYHWYNSLDKEGAAALMNQALEYLAKNQGFEDVDGMIRAKMADYAAQNLTYYEAAEELVADSWSGIFDSVEAMTRWAQFQREQADKNAGKSGAITKAVNAVKEMLNGIISRAKEVLTRDPENRAALRAQRLAQEEKKALQDAYFAHAEKAMDNLRAAKENAAAMEGNGAAKGVRFEIKKDANGETYIQIDEDILEGVPKEKWRAVVKQAIKERFPNGFERDGWKILNEERGRKEFLWSREAQNLWSKKKNVFADKMRMAANLDEIIQTANNVLLETPKHEHKGIEAFNRGKITIEVGANFYSADVVTAIKPDGREIFYDIVNIEKQKNRTPHDTYLKSEDNRGSLWESSNITIAQTDAPVKKNIRFQLDAPVEVDNQKELVAVHNLTEDNLREALELGGMPSPSIAVVKAKEGHSMYGPISLVFGSDTIDPMVNLANRVYGSDAWTPTRPGVEYKVDDKAAYAFEDAVYEASRDAFEEKFANASALRSEGVGDASEMSREELAGKLQNNTAVQLAYLKDQGETVQAVYRTESAELDSFGNDVLEKLVELAGADKIRRSMEEGDWDAMEALADKAADALTETRTHGALEGMNQRWEKRIENLRKNRRDRLIAMVNHAYKMLTDTSGGKTVLDVEATRQEIRDAAPEEKVKKWVYDQLENVVGEKGIRNGKEEHTPTGKKRSFAQLHYAYTLENLVQAMNQQQEARGQGVFGLSAKSLMSTATAEYRTLDEVRADKDRLQQMPEEEYNQLLETADREIEAVMQKLRQETTPHADNSFEEQEILGSVLMQAAQGKRTAAAIGKAFAKEDYIIGKDTAQMILKLYNDVAKIPTGYFEAKPQRAVGFDEVKAAILPDNASKGLIRQLKDAGVDVKLYKAGDDAQRTAVLNKVPNVRFQLTEQADREAKQSDQRQASRAIADKAAALDTLTQFFGLTRGVRVSQDSLDGLAVKWTRTNGSKADREKLAREARVLVEYLKADGADMAKAQSMAETLAGEVLDGATYRNSELWDEYPELHKLEYTVNKSGQAKTELVRRYGSWSEAAAEARRHGVTLRQAEGVRDGNPAEQYESIVNDNRAMGGTRDGARALWKTAAQQAGVDGAMSMESTEWLDVLMNLHDAIKPKMMSRFADDAEYEDARVELAGRMLGDVMNVPEMTDAQAIFEGILAHNLQVAKAAAGSEEQAAAVEKNLKGIQKGQKKLFNERLYQNRRTVGQHAEVQNAQANAKAEQQLNDILETQGVDITNLGDLNEKLTVLRETYERQWKEEKKRLKAERQEMMDEAKLEMRKLRWENADLARQVKLEQQRADKAEYSLLVQEDEIRDWELMSQQKAAEWYQEQTERNAIAMEVARQQRDEDVRVAKVLADKRVQKAREGRKMDEVKRGIRRNAAALNQLVLRPAPGKYVQQSLVVQAAEVAKLADMTILNQKAVYKLTALQDSISRSMGSKDAPNAMTEDLTQSKVPEMIAELRQSLDGSKQEKLARLREQLAEAEALQDSEKAEMLRDRLRTRIRNTENRTYLPMTLEQMQLLKAITSSTLHVIRTANKTLSLAKAEEVDKIASGAAQEVRDSKGNHPGGALDGMHNAITKYNLDMLGGERVFRMLGGYAKDGQMEKLAKMLNDGQRRQTEITVNGEKLFANVTGKANLKAMEKFAGPGAELVDIGLKDTKGNGVPLTHAQLCSLAMHLQNKDSMEHLMTGGLTVPDAKLYSKCDIEQAYQKGQTVQLGMLKDADGNPVADTIANAVEKALTDYDRAWIADMKDFFGRYTTNLINETSMQLLGYNRAQVKNYYPIAVDKGALATQIDGLKLDATIEGRGFLKNRVKSSQPILLEECSNVVQRSLRDTAAYAGLALPIRDVQKVLNSNVEMDGGLANLKNGVLKEQWGKDAVDYVNDLLTDLQTTQRKRSNGVSRALGRLRGNYAGAILTLNPGVAIAQAASLPTAGAVLGMDTMAAVVPFVKNMSAKQRAALEAEIEQHGDALLAWRKRGSQRGELSSIGRTENLAEKAMDALPKSLTGWINGMDEITVAALWEGSKQYVKNHAAEFADGADKVGSEAYWNAVNQTYQKVIEQTQPNYTTMQRAGIQRNPDEMVKTFTMFTTQRFQNYGILADAVMDYKTQKARDAAQSTVETKAEVQRAGQQLRRAVVSQVAQTAVFALMKIGADFLLHRWDKEQDENGDMTLESLLKRFTDLFTESAAGNFLYGSEVYSLANNAINGKDYDVISATNISVVNDLAGDVTKWFAEWRKDTSEMTEEELAKHHDKLWQRTMTLLEDGMEIYGVPYGNGKKIVDAVRGYWDDIENLKNGGKFTFNSLPASATGQYDRLFNAYLAGDSEEGKAAMEKLTAMGKEDEVYSKLKARLVKYDSKVEAAAKARNAGEDATREQLTREIVSDVYTVMGIQTGTKADAAKREAVIDCVTGAVNNKADTLLKNGGTSVTDELVDALDSGNAKSVQAEVDRLLKAGKSVTTVKSKITEVCKPEYTAGSDYDREQMEDLLLGLVDADGKELYTQKTLNEWVTAAEKAAEKEPEKDPWEGLR